MLSAELLEVSIYHIRQIREEYNRRAAETGRPQVWLGSRLPCVETGVLGGTR
jgi:hypothetical protein